VILPPEPLCGTERAVFADFIPDPGNVVRRALLYAGDDNNVLYTWSVSVILNPQAPSRDIVASASLLRTAAVAGLDNGLYRAPANQRAALLAQAGLWYDAVAAAAEMEGFDRHAALDALMDEAGLVEPARYDRQAAGVIPVR
jgi:hypothetical protein